MGSKSYSKGICWIDDCRIPFVDEGDSNKACNKNHEQGKYDTDFFEGYFKRKGSDIKGRFPANILVCDDMLNDGNISSKGKMKLHKPKGKWGNPIIEKNSVDFQGDKGTNSRYYDIDKWFDKILND